jgi:hypothetical protein
MARRKGTQQKTGGRKRGTPNVHPNPSIVPTAYYQILKATPPPVAVDQPCERRFILRLWCHGDA